MTVVVVIALSMWGVRLYRLSVQSRAQAAWNARMESRYRQQIILVTRVIELADRIITQSGEPDEATNLRGPTKQDLKRHVAERDRAVRFANYYENLKNKYERAARYPWLAIEPDPSAPD
jgi:hypothetical protein